MTDPTPTRDEAVPTGWKLVPVEPTEEMIEAMCDAYRQTRRSGVSGMTLDAQFRAEFAQWFAAYSAMLAAYSAMLASAPAPASGGVDAVALREICEDMLDMHHGRQASMDVDAPSFGRGAAAGWDAAVSAFYKRALASLSPAATPVSEAEPVAWQTVSDFVDEMLRDWSGGDDCRMGFGVNGATVTKGQFRAVRSALASLSPAATPVSEAGGEAAERSWRRTKFEFIGAMRQALINSGLTREQVIIADNAITEAFSDLAKPASSPAGGGEP